MYPNGYIVRIESVTEQFAHTCDLQMKPETCAPCPLYQTSKGFGCDRIGEAAATPTSISKVQLVVWLEALGRKEVEQGMALVGDSRFVMEQWGFRAVPELQLMNERAEIMYANTLRCQPPKVKDKNYPIGDVRVEAERLCRQYDQLPPASVPMLLCGEVAQRLWFRQELLDEDNEDKRLGREVKGLMGRLGRVWTKDGRQFIFGPHPAYIMRQPQLIEHLHAVLRITWAVVDGTRKLWESPVGKGLPDRGEVGLDLEWTPDGAISINGVAW